MPTGSLPVPPRAHAPGATPPDTVAALDFPRRHDAGGAGPVQVVRDARGARSHVLPVDQQRAASWVDDDVHQRDVTVPPASLVHPLNEPTQGVAVLARPIGAEVEDGRASLHLQPAIAPAVESRRGELEVGVGVYLALPALPLAGGVDLVHRQVSDVDARAAQPRPLPGA